MEQITIPFCEPAPSDVIPMIVMVCLFILCGWLIRRWRKKRSSRGGK